MSDTVSGTGITINPDAIINQPEFQLILAVMAAYFVLIAAFSIYDADESCRMILEALLWGLPVSAIPSAIGRLAKHILQTAGIADPALAEFAPTIVIVVVWFVFSVAWLVLSLKAGWWIMAYRRGLSRAEAWDEFGKHHDNKKRERATHNVESALETIEDELEDSRWDGTVEWSGSEATVRIEEAAE